MRKFHIKIFQHFYHSDFRYNFRQNWRISQKYTRNRIISSYFFSVEFCICRAGLERIFFLKENIFRKFPKIMRKFPIKLSNTFTILIFRFQFPTELNKFRKKYTRNRIIISKICLKKKYYEHTNFPRLRKVWARAKTIHERKFSNNLYFRGKPDLLQFRTSLFRFLQTLLEFCSNISEKLYVFLNSTAYRWRRQESQAVFCHYWYFSYLFMHTLHGII
jgi:hypothetical protein